MVELLFEIFGLQILSDDLSEVLPKFLVFKIIKIFRLKILLYDKSEELQIFSSLKIDQFSGYKFGGITF